jgi:type II secretory pathway pseudopilin PulG
MRERTSAARLARIPAEDLDLERIQDQEHSWVIHTLAAAWIAIMLILAKATPLKYTVWVQEDHFIEWWTVGLFAAAGIARIRYSLPGRRIFDLLVAAFCIFVAGEEFSWGQRLVGFTPPDYFLEHNTQQEFSLHNVADIIGHPKLILILALLGYGVVLPLAARLPRGSDLLNRVGATAPRMDALPWFVVAVLLLLINPVEYTGEWVETLAGALFLVTARPTPRFLGISIIASIVAAVLLTMISARGVAESPAALACAERQARALLDDVAQGSAATPKLQQYREVLHKSVRNAIDDEYLNGTQLTAFTNVGCGPTPTHTIDPWGMPYWIRVELPANGQRQITIYSLGPNRRRDLSTAPAGGDDVTVSRVVFVR